jgi:prefoldin subunit 5
VLGLGSQIAFDAGAEQSLEMLYGFHERKCKQLNERLRVQGQEIKALDEKGRKLAVELAELVNKGAQKKLVWRGEWKRRDGRETGFWSKDRDSGC